MSDLRLSNTPANSPEDPTQKAPPAGKKSFGIGCVLIGCLTLFLMVALPIVGGLIYIATLDEAGYGSIIVKAMHSDLVKEAVVEQAKTQQPGMTAEQVKFFEQVYDRFLAEYDKLPDDKREQVNKIFGKFFHEKAIEKKPLNPEDGQRMMEEVLKIMNIDFSGLAAPAVTTAPVTPTTPPATTTTPPATTTSPTSTTTPADPYSFDLPPSQTPPAPTNTTQPSQYDF